MPFAPTSWPTGSGSGVAPITRQSCFSATPVTVANGASALLPCDGNNGPDALLDRSVTTAPTILTAGVYVVAVSASISGITAGGKWRLTLELDASGDDATFRQEAAAPAAFNSVTGAYYLAAGAVIKVTAHNNDGASPRDFTIYNVSVQRVS